MNQNKMSRKSTVLSDLPPLLRRYLQEQRINGKDYESQLKERACGQMYTYLQVGVRRVFEDKTLLLEEKSRDEEILNLLSILFEK